MGLVLAAVTVAVYSRSFDGPFIYDDLSAIVKNPHTRALWPLTTALTAPPRNAATARPVVALSLAINYQISGLKVWSYHALNLLLHVVCALLLMALVYRTLGRPDIPPWLAQHRGGLAMTVALLWAVHPLNSEAVVYVIQRTELLVSLFCLLTLMLASAGFDSPRSEMSNRKSTPV